MTNKTPKDITLGTANDNSVVHASDATISNLSRSHVERDISRLQGTSPTYSSSKTYNVNDLTTETGIEYRCITPITTGETFTPGKWSTVGIGDVAGPESSVDDTITTFDGISGKLIQSSGVSIDTTNDVSGVRDLSLSRSGANSQLNFTRDDETPPDGSTAMIITFNGNTDVTTTPVEYGSIVGKIENNSDTLRSAALSFTSYVDGVSKTFLDFNLTGVGTVSLNETTLMNSARLEFSKGDNVSSAEELVLGDDGNVFNITGTTVIDGISPTGWQPGSVVHLRFNSSVMINNGSGSGTDIILEGGVNFQTDAGDTLSLYYDGEEWIEFSRTGGTMSQTPWLQNINAASFSLSDFNMLQSDGASNIMGEISLGNDEGIFWDNQIAGNTLSLIVNTSDQFVLNFIGTDEYLFSSAEADFGGNDIVNLMDINIDGNINLNSNIRQIFQPGNANAGINIGSKGNPEPTIGVAGDIYFNTGDVQFRGYDGSKWIQLSDQVPIGTGAIYVTSQADLTSQLGGNLVIPASSNMTVVFLNTMSFNSPIEIGDDATVEFISEQNSIALSFSGSGAFFRNDPNGSTGTGIVRFTNFTMVGNVENTFCDILTSPTASFSITECILTAFATLGTVNGRLFLMDKCALVNFDVGFIIRGPIIVSIEDTIISTASIYNPTVFGLITNGLTVSSFRLDRTNHIDISGSDSLVFLDPNAGASSLFLINGNIVGTNTELFQTGVDIAVTSVATGEEIEYAKFTTTTPHGYNIGELVVNSGFTDANYNGTFEIVFVGTSTTYEVITPFTATDVGSVTSSSLDHTDPRVIADNNPGKPHSEAIAEIMSTTTLEVDGSAGVGVPVVAIAPTSNDWLNDPTTQRFTVDTSTGAITYVGIDDIVSGISFGLTATQASGASQSLNFDIRINEVLQSKSIIVIDTSVANVGTFIGGNFNLSTGDKIQLYKTNNTNTNNTNISAVTLLVQM